MELSPYLLDRGIAESASRRNVQLEWYDIIYCMIFYFLLLPKEGGYVFYPLCLFACLSVHKITQKVINGF